MRLSAAPLLALLAAAPACTSPQPCPSLLEECDGACVDVQSDRRHCGACGRACAAGSVCVAGACGSEALAPCAVRTGGAFVTLGACGAAVKLWIENEGFLSAAEERVGGPAPGVPVLAVRAGAGCDGQWSWSVNEVTATFQPAPPAAACQVCPAQIQADVGSYVATVGTWCPPDATVLSLVRR